MGTSAPTVVRVPSYQLRMYLVRSVDTENPPHVGRMPSPIVLGIPAAMDSDSRNYGATIGVSGTILESDHVAECRSQEPSSDLFATNSRVRIFLVKALEKPSP
jgi:hypothetical protein